VTQRSLQELIAGDLCIPSGLAYGLGKVLGKNLGRSYTWYHDFKCPSLFIVYANHASLVTKPVHFFVRSFFSFVSILKWRQALITDKNLIFKTRYKNDAAARKSLRQQAPNLQKLVGLSQNLWKKDLRKNQTWKLC